ARKTLDENPQAGRSLASAIVEKPRPLSAEETATLVQDRARITNEHRQAYADAADAMERGDTAGGAEARGPLRQADDEFEANDNAAKSSGYEQGFGLAARRMLSRPDYTMVALKQRAKVAKGSKLSAEQEQAFADLSKKIEEKDKRIAELEA